MDADNQFIEFPHFIGYWPRRVGISQERIELYLCAYDRSIQWQGVLALQKHRQRKILDFGCDRAERSFQHSEFQPLSGMVRSVYRCHSELRH